MLASGRSFITDLQILEGRSLGGGCRKVSRIIQKFVFSFTVPYAAYLPLITFYMLYNVISVLY